MLRTDAWPIDRWLTRLGIITAGKMPADEARVRIVALLPLLQDRFPSWAFSEASLAAVAEGATYFPVYAELTAALSAWVRDHRPPTGGSLLSGPAGASLDSSDAGYLAVFRRRAIECGPRRLAFLLSIVRQGYPEGARRAIEAEFGTPHGTTVHVRPPTLKRMPGADRREVGEPPPTANPRQSCDSDR